MASDSEDEDLKSAIALSLAAANESPASATKTQTPRQPNTTGFLGLDRKAMEAERLARISSLKRQRSISPPTSSRKALKLGESTTTLPSGAQLKMISSLGMDSPQSEAANPVKPEPVGERKPKMEEAPPFDPESLPCGAIKYPHGAVKKTWAFRHPRTKSDIKIEEVLEAGTLRTAVLSAFQWDVEWVLSKLKTPLKGGKTKCLFIMQAKEADLREKMLADTQDQRHYLKLCFPPMDGMINCMHSKLMLLFHPDKLRIAVPSANLLTFDWGETGVMENSVFMIDLPRADVKQEPDSLTNFGKELMYFLERQKVDEAVRDGLLNFDFSATQHMAFVHAAGGQTFGKNAERTGLPGLARAVRNLNLATSQLEVDFAASSIGMLNETYTRTFHAAARGEDIIEQASKEQASKKVKIKTKDFFNQHRSAAQNPQFALRIYFPTFDTVKGSTAGSAGTLCMDRKYWETPAFPKSMFRDYRSTRPGLLSHNKILLARGKAGSDADDGNVGDAKDVAWVYVGSANMSKSAWGEVVKDKRYGDWKVSCRNWECGVLLPVNVPGAADVKDEAIKKEVHDDEKVVSIKKERLPGDDSETEIEAEEGRIVSAKNERLPGDDSGTESEAEEEKIINVKKERLPGDDSETESEAEDAKAPVKKVPTASGPPVVDMSVFTSVIDVPFQIPGEKYRPRQRPWYFKEDA